MAIGVTAKLKIQEGKNEEFEAIFSKLMEAVIANESGCNFYALHKSRTEAQTYIVLEQYVDEEALTAHGATEYFLRLAGEMGGCMAAAPEIEYMDAI
jgi:quinol monooxygenase YgiN